MDEVKKMTAQELDAALNSLSNCVTLVTLRTLPYVGGAAAIDKATVGAGEGLATGG